MNQLQKTDPEIYTIIEQEKKRQQKQINLIASENYASKAILEATGSVLTNKYAEGYPGKRYYAGCEHVDSAEQLAIERCKKLFSVHHANVQPHSGSQANMGVMFAALKPGDTILGMSLAEGGHLTHGHPINFSGVFYNNVQYKVHPETNMLDYDEIEKIALECKPKLIIAGASAYSRIIDFEKFAYIAKKVKALLLADIAHIAGLIAANMHPTPVGHADFITSTTHKTLRGPRGGLIMCRKEWAEKIDKAIMPGIQGGPFMNVIAAKAVCFKEALQPNFKEYQQQIIKNAKVMAQEFIALGYDIVTGGTDNHLFIVDLRTKNINGRLAEQILEKVGITVSRSCIPFDPQKPWITSGIRIGTPAITTRGMQEEQAKEIVRLIDEALQSHDNEKTLHSVTLKITKLAKKHPIYC